GDRDVVLCDLAGRKVLHRLPYHRAKGLAFAPDGKTLVCFGAVEIALWDVATGKRLHPWPGHNGDVWAVTVSPDGKTVASAAMGDGTTRLWDAATGRALHVLPGHDFHARSCAF